jgi:phosphonate transport system substrate-binding protein
MAWSMLTVSKDVCYPARVRVKPVMEMTNFTALLCARRQIRSLAPAMLSRCAKIFLACAIAWMLAWQPASAQPSYTISIVPQISPLEIYRHWKPLVDYLSRETGSVFVIQMQNSIPEFEDALNKGVPDFAFMNPYHLVMARKHQPYIPLVRSGASDLRGILVVRNDSPIEDVRQLDGQVLVFPSPNAFGASLYLRALLTNQFNITFREKYVTTHANVYRHVVREQAIAGGGVHRTLANEHPSVKNRLRILYETPGVAPHPLCAHERVPAELRAQVTSILLKLGKDPAWSGILTKTLLDIPVQSDYDKDYAAIESLGLEKFIGPMNLAD